MSYQMKDVIRKTNLTEKAIRLYIDKGIVSPVNKADFRKNHYYFEEKQIQELKEIALLRAFRFSLQDISYIFQHNSGIAEILDRHVRMLEAESVIQKIWNYDVEERNAIQSKDDLIEYLSASQNAFECDRLYGNLFQNIEEAYFPHENKTIFKMRYLGIILFFVAGVITGGLFVRYHTLATQEASQRNRDFLYMIEEQLLSVENVKWKEYPGFRQVSFEMSGIFTINVPKGYHCVLQNLSDESLLVEKTERPFACLTGMICCFTIK